MNLSQLAKAAGVSVATVSKAFSGSDEIMEIITQDTAPYFAGQKSLNDVVKQLQSKMNIYINEQR